MTQLQKEMIERWKSKTPDERRKGLARLARAMEMPDLIPVEEMTKEEVEESLRRNGFTDDDFTLMQNKLNELLSKYRANVAQATTNQQGD